MLPVRFEATRRSQHAAASSVCDRGRPDSSVEARLARAVQLALLLLRRSVAGCAVGSLQLHQHSASDLRLLLPLCLGASEALGRQEPRLLGRRLLSLHLSHAYATHGSNPGEQACHSRVRALPWTGACPPAWRCCYATQASAKRQQRVTALSSGYGCGVAASTTPTSAKWTRVWSGARWAARLQISISTA